MRQARARYTIVGLGELLWDILPGRRELGGAPTNFAYVCGLLGDVAVVASRVGTDELGRDAIGRLEQTGLTAEFLQVDDEHPTGTVLVKIDEGGQPSYTSRQDVAWDYLEWIGQWEELAGRADAVCFGTLAQRAAQSRSTIKKFLQAMRRDSLRLFDVNLRHSLLSAELLAESLELSTAVKLNDEEVPRVSEMLALGVSEEQAFAKRLMRDFNLRLVVITRGARGSLILSEDEIAEHSGFKVAVVDTIGAGDAFGAALVHYFLRRAPLAQISDRANRLGAWVATQAGATPAIKEGTLQQTIESIESESFS
ncbi:MAG: carbohydrate kinase [Pyrinomonadaceae bacterium]